MRKANKHYSLALNIAAMDTDGFYGYHEMHGYPWIPRMSMDSMDTHEYLWIYMKSIGIQEYSWIPCTMHQVLKSA